MISMIWRGYLENFLAKSLVDWLSTRGIEVFKPLCGIFPADNERLRLFIHNFRFRCKINKFISFFSKNQSKNV